MSTTRRTIANLAATSIHIRIRPQPSNLSESREILRALQRFGEITTFRHLRYEYHNPAANSAIAIFRDAGSARRALDASPVRFALEKVVGVDEGEEGGGDNSKGISEEGRDGEEKELDDDGQQTLLTDDMATIIRPPRFLNHTPQPPPPPPSPSQNPQKPTSSTSHIPFSPPSQSSSPPSSQQSQTLFSLTLSPSHTIHQDFIERQPFWTKFVPKKSMAQEDLAKVVPHVGLSDVTKRASPRTPTWLLEQRAGNVRATRSLREVFGEGGGDVR